MRKVNKVLAIGAMVAAAAGVGLVARAETPGPGFGPSGMHGAMGPGMMGMQGGPRGHGFGDPSAHLAALKADLGIKPDQAAAWDTYAKVAQDTAEQMRATRSAVDPDAVRAMSPQDRQAFMTSMHVGREKAFATLATAARTLLPSLDDAQKAKAQDELPGLAVNGPGMMRHTGMGMIGGGPMMGVPTAPGSR